MPAPPTVSEPRAAQRPLVAPQADVYLLRHGETVWNRTRRMQGTLDSPLTLQGIAQVRQVAEALRREIAQPADYRMVASPLGRVLQSAAIVCDVLGLDFDTCVQEECLREMTWGRWDGLTHPEIEQRDPGELARRWRDRWHYVPPGGESYQMVAARLRPWLARVGAHERLIVVAHGAVGRTLRGLYTDLTPTLIPAQEEPQDACFRLHQGAVTRIDAMA